MLVLSRQRDESIMIGDDVEITIVDVRGDKVRLGINAPKSIPVHRREVYDAIQREKKQAKEAKEQPSTEVQKQPEPEPQQAKEPQAHQEKEPEKVPEEQHQNQK